MAGLASVRAHPGRLGSDTADPVIRGVAVPHPQGRPGRARAGLTTDRPGPRLEGQIWARARCSGVGPDRARFGLWSPGHWSNAGRLVVRQRKRLVKWVVKWSLCRRSGSVRGMYAPADVVNCKSNERVVKQPVKVEKTREGGASLHPGLGAGPTAARWRCSRRCPSQCQCPSRYPSRSGSRAARGCGGVGPR